MPRDPGPPNHSSLVVPHVQQPLRFSRCERGGGRGLKEFAMPAVHEWRGGAGLSRTNDGNEGSGDGDSAPSTLFPPTPPCLKHKVHVFTPVESKLGVPRYDVIVRRGRRGRGRPRSQAGVRLSDSGHDVGIRRKAIGTPPGVSKTLPQVRVTHGRGGGYLEKRGKPRELPPEFRKGLRREALERGGVASWCTA